MSTHPLLTALWITALRQQGNFVQLKRKDSAAMKQLLRTYPPKARA